MEEKKLIAETNKIYDLLAKQKYELALKNLDTLLKENPDSAKLYTLKSMTLIENKKYGEAMRVLNSLNKRKMGREYKENIYSLRSLIYTKQKKYNKAILEIRKIKDRDISEFYVLAISYENTNRENLAIKQLEKILTKDPKNIPVLRKVFVYYFGLKRYKKSEVLINRIMKTRRDPVALGYKGLLYMKKKDYKKSLFYLKAALKLSKVWKMKEMFVDRKDKKKFKANTLYAISKIYLKIGRMEESCKYAKEGLKYDPKNKHLKKILNEAKKCANK